MSGGSSTESFAWVSLAIVWASRVEVEVDRTEAEWLLPWSVEPRRQGPKYFVLQAMEMDPFLVQSRVSRAFSQWGHFSRFRYNPGTRTYWPTVEIHCNHRQD